MLRHRLDRYELKRLREHLRRFPEITRAFLFRIELKAMPTLPYHVMIVELARKGAHRVKEARDMEVCRELAESLMLDTLITVYPYSGVANLHRKLKKRNDALVYPE